MRSFVAADLVEIGVGHGFEQFRRDEDGGAEGAGGDGDFDFMGDRETCAFAGGAGVGEPGFKASA